MGKQRVIISVDQENRIGYISEILRKSTEDPFFDLLNVRTIKGTFEVLRGECLDASLEELHIDKKTDEIVTIFKVAQTEVKIPSESTITWSKFYTMAGNIQEKYSVSMVS